MELPDKNTFKEKRNMLLFFLVFIIGIGVYQFGLRKKINTEGVYLKGTIVKSEGYKGGVLTTIKYSYNGKNYENRVHSEKIGGVRTGDSYFLKILPDNPDAVILLEDNPVPECLLTVDVPVEGWKDLPKCTE